MKIVDNGIGSGPQMTEIEQADFLLSEWYRYDSHWRPTLDYPSTSPNFSQATSSRQWEDSTDASCGGLHVVMMKSVEYCVGQLPVLMRGAIGIEMRNRHVGARVWRSGNANAPTYIEALVAIVPIFRKKGCLD